MQKIASLFILFIFYSCTENPFGGDKKIADKTISGYVKLEEVEYYPKGFHGGVFVWSKDLGLQTKTDIDGSFEFILPASNEPTSGAIIDGDYEILFFLGNYKISKVTITFAGGEVVNDDKVINLEGELRRDVSMRREFFFKVMRIINCHSPNLNFITQHFIPHFFNTFYSTSSIIMRIKITIKNF